MGWLLQSLLPTVQGPVPKLWGPVPYPVPTPQGATAHNCKNPIPQGALAIFSPIRGIWRLPPPGCDLEKGYHSCYVGTPPLSFNRESAVRGASRPALGFRAPPSIPQNQLPKPMTCPPLQQAPSCPPHLVIPLSRGEHSLAGHLSCCGHLCGTRQSGSVPGILRASFQSVAG